MTQESGGHGCRQYRTCETAVHAHPCDNCGQLLFFDNSVCLRCGTAVAFDAANDRIRPLEDAATNGFAPCEHRDDRGCNWLVDMGGLTACLACRLTRGHPDPDGDADTVERWLEVERAKRHLVAELLLIGLPVVERADDPELGLAFDLLTSRDGPVTTGHADGIITLDLAEADDLHRERMRIQLDEPYRTVLGHLRHEIGHHYWQRLVSNDPDRLEACRAVFGDDRLDYGEALERSYADGPPAGWPEHHVSSYAAAHPWEDFAETFAHLLHITDGLRTADTFGLRVGATAQEAFDDADGAGPPRPVDRLVADWLSLTLALNAMSRSIGSDDLYPFVLSDEVVDKLAWVHDLVHGR